MRRISGIGMTVALLLSSGPAMAGPESACQGCHEGELSLRGTPAEQLGRQILDIAEGRAAHVTPIPRLSEEALRALVENLTAADSAD